MTFDQISNPYLPVSKIAPFSGAHVSYVETIMSAIIIVRLMWVRTCMKAGAVTLDERIAALDDMGSPS
jgi:hypothetical protein